MLQNSNIDVASYAYHTPINPSPSATSLSQSDKDAASPEGSTSQPGSVGTENARSQAQPSRTPTAIPAACLACVSDIGPDTYDMTDFRPCCSVASISSAMATSRAPVARPPNWSAPISPLDVGSRDPEDQATLTKDRLPRRHLRQSVASSAAGLLSCHPLPSTQP